MDPWGRVHRDKVTGGFLHHYLAIEGFGHHGSGSKKRQEVDVSGMNQAHKTEVTVFQL